MISHSKTVFGLVILGVVLGACSDEGRKYPGACEVAMDDGEDGVIDYLEVRTYNKNGDPLTVELDLDNDGVTDNRTEHTYNAEGLLASTVWTQGVQTALQTWYTYHANGELASERWDEDGDGVWDTEYQYNESGLQVLNGWDDDGDGVIDRGYGYTYGPTDLLQKEQFYDAWPFDSPSWENNYQYDSDSYLIEVETFNIAQQAVTRIKTHSWNADHTVEDMAWDIDNDGLTDSSYHAEYDLDGNQIYYEPDEDGDGQSDYINTQTYADGLLIESTQDQDADGVVDSRTTRTYDSAENLLESSTDSPVDGTPDSVTTHSYDKHGNRTSSLWHGTSDSSLTTYDYSCW